MMSYKIQLQIHELNYLTYILLALLETESIAVIRFESNKSDDCHLVALPQYIT